MKKAAILLTAILITASCGTQMNTLTVVPDTYTAATEPFTEQAPDRVTISAPSPEDSEILAEGVAAISNSHAAARDHAIDDALRNAVEQGVGTHITSETQVNNFQLIEDNIYSNSQGYVSSYRIIDQQVEGQIYRVVIKAKVKSGIIENDLAAMGILLSEQGRPKVMVLIRELQNPADLSSVSMNGDVFETRVMEHFRSRGFPVVDAATVQRILKADQLRLILQGDIETARLAGLQAGAEIVVSGTVNHARTERIIGSSPREIHSCTTSTRAVNANTGSLMAGSGLTLELPFSQSAVRNRAADSTAAYLENEILRTWTRNTNITEIVVSNTDYERLASLKADIMEFRGVTDVAARNLTGSRATVEVVSETSTEEIMDWLSALETISITGFSGNRIEVTTR
ncbi:hypothetical protein CSA37_08595 [Candidatus Fermentibacteria bacterium]|nr:MAG: hypothetical protein CSA37_08595 [Candidatus Fermentibacteria bacterium]